MLGKEVENFGTALEVLPRSFIVALISQYDAFLGRLIRTIFYVKPELLNASEKQLSFSKLLAFSSIEVAREHIIEKEVESILRESHTDQFKWLENKIGSPLTKDLLVWVKFIEITERRNLFVHTNGVVSEQYLNVCRLNNIDSANGCKAGDKLEVTNEYFKDAYRSVFEVGIKLAHVLWRKLQPEQREEADSNLNNICYELIYNEDYGLAIMLLDFAAVLKTYSSEKAKLTFIINQAQALKWSGKDDVCKKIISEIDWTAKSDDFKLASAVLLQDFDSAATIMKRLGINDEVSKTAYRDWPLFKQFRKSEAFVRTYEEVFGEPFKAAEVTTKTVARLLKEMDGKSARDTNEQVH